MPVTLRDAVDEKTRLRLRTEVTKHVPPAKPTLDKSILANGPVQYKTVRAGRTSHAWLVEIKKDDVVLKDDLDRKDSYTLGMTKFLKFYVRAD